MLPGGVVGPLGEVPAVGLFPLCLEAEYPLVEASVVCGPSMDESVSASAHYPDTIAIENVT